MIFSGVLFCNRIIAPKVASHIDKEYKWNEWDLRRDALKMADIRQRQTQSTQTQLSAMKAEQETQVYLPREVATNARGFN